MQQRDFYRPPENPGSEPHEPGGSSVKAVLAGLGVCLVGGYALRTVVAIIATYFISMNMAADIGSEDPGMSSDDLGALLVSLAMAATLCMTILAGFVCARLSLNNILRDTGMLIAIAGGLKLAYGLWLDPPLLVAVTTLGTVAALIYGAWLGIRSLRRKEEPAEKA